jgi:hypothetical protein
LEKETGEGLGLELDVMGCGTSTMERQQWLQVQKELKGKSYYITVGWDIHLLIA